MSCDQHIASADGRLVKMDQLATQPHLAAWRRVRDWRGHSCGPLQPKGRVCVGGGVWGVCVGYAVVGAYICRLCRIG